MLLVLLAAAWLLLDLYRTREWKRFVADSWERDAEQCQGIDAMFPCDPYWVEKAREGRARADEIRRRWFL